MKNSWLITIGGFKAVIDPDGLIVDCDSEIKKLENTPLKETFEKYKKRAPFKRVEKVEYPFIVKDDAYQLLRKMNPVLDVLREKFDCEIY